MLFGFLHKRPALPTIHLHNTATGRKEEFKSLEKGVVTMYSCGPTVYDHIHIGNLRAYLLPDLLTRLFLRYGYKVKSTINFTDFGHLTDDADAGEDKMMKGMRREGYEITLENMRIFPLPYIESFKNDNLAFGNLPPSEYARASDYIAEQIKLIETLEQKGYTYRISDGVYFDVTKFPAYGIIGNIDIEKIKAGARVEVNPEKHHPADFALWKNGDLGWESRWGKGFPGWHIECTAMVFATLGKQIDVHTGGEDLQYTHHNGEIAQAECVTGKKYVSYWLHNSHVKIDQQKIAKSLGNGLRLRHLSDRGFAPADYRFWLLQSHYRTTANFTWEALEAARAGLLRLRRLVYEELGDVTPGKIDENYEGRVLQAVADDLDTPTALAILFELAKDQKVHPENKLATIHFIDSLLALGLSKGAAEGRAELGVIDEIPDEVKKLLEDREEARQARDFALADHLRDQITAQGYLIEDGSDGAKLRKK
ncbi:cysteine--tRNA ligase [Candidatus Kaiserbacteria bacterium RIFOXYB1_FULL_46_14]|uniref:Cysteine--tRNA ligase n=1 Tax=Candidatus Kaiserbacteria bacterium RIFOXYB1_FULL_46_14 TaxID=1798531 RepID=A0A1F6FJI6_9BACT|nr:MAG: cysteine--tRNA ligase [Candidatus Kaiserbacteria bacterium RIFOXYB1_FULL_46_14]